MQGLNKRCDAGEALPIERSVRELHNQRLFKREQNVYHAHRIQTMGMQVALVAELLHRDRQARMPLQGGADEAAHGPDHSRQ